MTAITEHVYLAGSGKFGNCLTHPLDSNVYLIAADDNAMALVDAGCGLGHDQILRRIRQDGFDPATIMYLFLTHYHADHIGGVANLAGELPALTVCGSSETIRTVIAGDEERSSLRLARELGIYPNDFRLKPCPALNAKILHDGDTELLGNMRITALATPGHSAGHYAYLLFPASERAGLFGGDCLFPGGKIIMQDIPDCSYEDYVRTLRKLLDYPAKSLFPGHFMPDADNGLRHLRSAIDVLDRGGIPENALP